MSYDALTIDTQVVYSNGLKVDTGLVGQLDQYRDGLVKFMLSEIYLRVIHKALTEKAKTSQDALSKAIKSRSSNGQQNKEHIDALKNVQAAIQ